MGEGGGECWYELRDNGAAFSKYQTLQPRRRGFAFCKRSTDAVVLFARFLSSIPKFEPVFQMSCGCEKVLIFNIIFAAIFHLSRLFSRKVFLEIEKNFLLKPGERPSGMALCIVCTLYGCT